MLRKFQTKWEPRLEIRTREIVTRNAAITGSIAKWIMRKLKWAL
jgi:hypothetical protein